MRCRKHLSDLSSTIGVCASCLRDRLSILDGQQYINSPIRNANPSFYNSSNNHDNNNNNKQCRSQQQPMPALIFPRSVSPYISRRKSEPTPRFYSTPQVSSHAKKKKKERTFGLFGKLFRSRSTTATVDSATVVIRRSKGMSPEEEWEQGEEREMEESSPARWVTRPSPARVRPSPSRAASMAFCLSPLVRASPARNRGGMMEGVEVKDKKSVMMSSGLCHKKPSLSEAASFCANRSRKMADFGRLDRKR